MSPKRRECQERRDNLDPTTPSHKKKGLEFDFFYSHCWGTDEIGRDNHERVRNLVTMMASKGFKNWFDENELKPGGGEEQGGFRQSICEGVSQATFVVVCVSRAYMRKVRDGAKIGQDNCQFEFNLICQTKSIRNVIALVMEPCCLDQSEWTGSVLGVLGDKLYIDYSNDSKLEVCADKLGTLIFEMVPTGIRRDCTIIDGIMSKVRNLQVFNCVSVNVSNVVW